MRYKKTIVCLANSKRMGGACVAGKEFLRGCVGDWIRPVSERDTREVSKRERYYDDGTEPQLLDIVTIPMEEFLPEGHQIENHLIDPEEWWAKEGIYLWRDIPSMLDSPPTLWVNGYHSTSGMNNRLPSEFATGGSLYLIDVSEIVLLVGPKAPQFSDSKRAVRAQFRYHRVKYVMDVTDPDIETTYLDGDDGDYVIDEPYLCVSLAAVHKDGYCYKLVAAILTKDRIQ